MYRNLLLAVLLALVVAGCAPFSLSSFNKQPFNFTNLAELEGCYNTVPEGYILASPQSGRALARAIFDRGTIRPEDVIDAKLDVPLSFCIKVLNHNQMQLSYYRDQQFQGQQTVNFQLKDDGFLYVETDRTQVMGVPYLNGGVDVYKLRLKREDQNLVAQVATHQSWAHHLVFLREWNSECWRYLYQRVDDTQAKLVH